MRKLINTLVFVVGFLSLISAQAAPYTLEELVKLGVEHSYVAQNATEQWQESQYDHKVSRQTFMPKWFFNANSGWSWDKSDGQLQQRRQFTMGPSMQVKTPLGTRLDLLANQGILGGSADRSITNTASVRLTQPLLKQSGLRVNRIPLKQADTQLMLNQVQYEENLSELIDSIILHYHTYQQSLLNQQIQQAQTEQAKQFLERLHLQIEAGRSAQNDYLQAELEVARQVQQQIETDRLVKKEYQALLLVLGLPETEVVEIEPFHLTDYTLVNEQEALQESLLKNRQLAQLRIQLRNLEYQTILAKDDLRWELDLSSEFSMKGSDGQAAHAFQEFAHNRDGGSSIGLTLKIPLGDRLPREKNLHQNQYQIRATKRQIAYTEKQLAQTLHDYYADIEAKKQQLYFSEQTVLLAEKSWQNAKLKLDSGRSTVFEVLSLHTQLAQAKINHIQAQMALSLAYVALDRQLGKTLSRWGIDA